MKRTSFLAAHAHATISSLPSRSHNNNAPGGASTTLGEPRWRAARLSRAREPGSYCSEAWTNLGMAHTLGPRGLGPAKGLPETLGHPVLGRCAGLAMAIKVCNQQTLPGSRLLYGIFRNLPGSEEVAFPRDCDERSGDRVPSHVGLLQATTRIFPTAATIQYQSALTISEPRDARLWREGQSMCKTRVENVH